MKKKIAILISLAMVLTFALAACGGGGGEEGEEVVDLVDGAAYGYAGDDPVEAACYAYMVEEYKHIVEMLGLENKFTLLCPCLNGVGDVEKHPFLIETAVKYGMEI